MVEMRNIAWDIINLDYKSINTTFDDLWNDFLDVMRKYKIMHTQVSLNKNGDKEVSANSPEWTMCRALFFDMLKSDLEFKTMIDVPKEFIHEH